MVEDPQLSFDFDAAAHVLAQAHQPYPVIIKEDDVKKLTAMEWGVIADYMTTPEKIKQSRQWMCNAQSEKVLDDPKSFWKRIRKRRCLWCLLVEFMNTGK